MHEATVTRELVRKIEVIASEHGARRVTVVRLRVGPLAGLSGDHLREHFEHDALGTVAEGATLEVTSGSLEEGDFSGDIVLDSIEIEQE